MNYFLVKEHIQFILTISTIIENATKIYQYTGEITALYKESILSFEFSCSISFFPRFEVTNLEINIIIIKFYISIL